jgi:hypothetical protein
MFLRKTCLFSFNNFKLPMLKKNKNIIVAGSGIGGLACA